MFGVKRPAQQPDDARSQASATDSSPNDTSQNGSSTTGSALNGSAPADSAPNGSAPADSAPNGSAPNGSKPAGAPAAVADADTQPASSGSQPPTSGGEQPGPSGSSGRPSVRLIALSTAAVAAMTAGVVFAVVQSSPSQPGLAGSGSEARSAGPVRLTAITPAGQATGVDGADPIVVSFSGPMSPSSPKPTITPSVAGSWTANGNSLIFTPTTPFQPSTKVTVTVPSGTSGVHAADGGLLKSRVTSQFTTGTYSQAGLAVLLAEQGYLPLTWGPERGGLAVAGMQSQDPAAQTPQGIAYSPPLGTFTWQPGYPSTLEDQWSPDQGNVLLAGAVMAFESEHNMPMSASSLTPQLWNALFAAQRAGERNANGYTYAIASKGSPETLTIWHNGQVVQHSLANTGIPVAPTVDGTFPVFERFRNQIMQGTNPDGSHYADPVQYVAYFNGGDAVHYFPRGSYGYPQSLGCVELDLSDAAHAWPYLTYGSLVSVVG